MHSPSNDNSATIPADRWAHRRTEPRPLALLWILYLIAASIVSFSLTGSFLSPAPDLYRLATRVLFFLAALGVSIVWPMLRLSQARPQSPRTSILLDLAVILPPLHCVVWPQLFDWMSRWSLTTVAAVAMCMTAWTVLIGAVLAFALQSSPTASPSPALTRHRSGWMVGLLALVVLGPALSLVLPSKPRVEPWLMLSPVGSALELLRDRSWSGEPSQLLPLHWWALGLTAGLAVALWLVLFRQTPAKPLQPPGPGSPTQDMAPGLEQA